MRRNLALKLESISRMRRTRRVYASERSACVALQALVRTVRTRRDFRGKQRAANEVNRLLRGKLGRVEWKRAKKQSTIQRDSAVLIQSLYRGNVGRHISRILFKARENARLWNHSAVVVQTSLRRMQSHSKYSRLHFALSLVLRWIRKTQRQRWFRRTLRCVVGVQSIIRGFRARLLCHWIRKSRSRWAHLLSKNEMVLYSRPVLRIGRFGGKREQLLATDAPRYLAVDLVSDTVSAELPFSDDVQVNEVDGSNGKRFVVESGSQRLRFSDLVDSCEHFVHFHRCVREYASLRGDAAMMREIRDFQLKRGLEGCPVESQGFLDKQAIKSKRNWKRRWFVLQGGRLSYFKNDGD